MRVTLTEVASFLHIDKSAVSRAAKKGKMFAEKENISFPFSDDSRPIKSTSQLRPLFVAAALLVSGCAVGPNYVRPPAPAAPEEWMEIGSPVLSSELPDYREWWTLFDDPALNSLVEMAYAQNLPLRIAGVRVLEARAQRLVAIGSFFPQTQQASAAYSRNLRSKHLHPSSGFSILDRGVFSRTFNMWTAGFDAMWEVDLWGKFQRGIEAATANLDASIESYDDVLVTLVAEVAANYVKIRAYEERLRVTLENVELQKKTLELTEKRFKYGAVTKLDVEQARANWTNTHAMVPQLEISLRQTQNALCILLGMYPHDLTEVLGGAGSIPTAPAEVAVGIPAELLRRRPDVRRAERKAAAQVAQIGVIVSDLYPHVILKGSIGVEAEDFSDFFKDLSMAGAVGPSIQWDILNYGRIVNQARAQNARAEEAIVDYQDTVLHAYAEAENAIVAYLLTRERTALLAESVDAATRSVDLSLIQYRDGIVDFISVLNAQAFLTQQQDNLIQSREDVASSLIALNKALGGGWEIRLGEKFVPAETRERIRSRFGWTAGWWPRLSLGWPFSRRSREESLATTGTGSPGGEAPDGETDAGDESRTHTQSTAEKPAHVSFQRIPTRLSRPGPDTGEGHRE